MTNETHSSDAASDALVPSDQGISTTNDPVTQVTPQVGRARRTVGVRFLPWLLTGALLGLVGGVWLGLTTDMDSRYTVNTQVAYFGAMGAALGAMLLGLVAAVLDWWLLRRR